MNQSEQLQCWKRFLCSSHLSQVSLNFTRNQHSIDMQDRKLSFVKMWSVWISQIYVESARFFPEHFHDVLNINLRINRSQRNARSIMLSLLIGNLVSGLVSNHSKCEIVGKKYRHESLCLMLEEINWKKIYFVLDWVFKENFSNCLSFRPQKLWLNYRSSHRLHFNAWILHLQSCVSSL